MIENVRKCLFTHKFQLIGFVLSLLALWNAVWLVQLLYGVVLLLVMLITRGKVKFLLSLVVTVVLVLFFMPYVIKGAHMVSGKVMSMLVPKPELVYDGRKEGQPKPLISVVIPAYNYADYVARAIKSAATQDIDMPYEVVVVDDASTDETLARAVEEAKKYANIRVYANKKNRGLISNKNNGIALAEGEWIFNLDADDFVTEDALSKLYSLVRDYHAELAYTWYDRFGTQQGVDELVGGRVISFVNCIPNFILYSKKDWKKYGGYSYLFSKGIEDWAFQTAFYLDNKKIIRSEKVLAFYFVKDDGRNNDVKPFYWPLWWMMQEYMSYQYDWNLRFRLFLVGFNKNLIGRLSAMLWTRLFENNNLDKLPFYEVH